MATLAVKIGLKLPTETEVTVPSPTPAALREVSMVSQLESTSVVDNGLL